MNSRTPLSITWEGSGNKREDLEIRHGLVPTPFGKALAAWTPQGICAFHFIGERFRRGEELLEELRRTWAGARLRKATDEEAKTPHALSKLHLRGTPFQIEVWRALLTIPSGETMTYAGLAKKIGRPTAQRAVGTAVGRNPVAWFIPCHRVIPAAGGIGGYRWGMALKRAILVREGAVGKSSVPGVKFPSLERP